MTNPSVFISAVSSEFSALRRELASSLRRAGWDVVFHDELRYGRETLLADLEAEIAPVEACVFIIGQRSGGGFPTEAETASLSDLTPPGEARRAPYNDLLPPGETRASYTQWEFLLTGKHKRRLLVYEPGAEFTQDPPPDAPHADDDPVLQARFVAWLTATGVTRTPFVSIDALCRAVLEQLPALVRTGPTHGLPPSLGTRFVGREDFLVRVRDTLTQSNTTAITAAISGMGGIGKTRAAAEYAWAHRADYPGGMLMIPAATSESLLTHLSNLTTPLGIPGMDARSVEDRRAAVVNWLRSHRDWLLILDHVDTDDGMQAAHDLRGELPHGHVLLTSRLSTLPGEFLGLQLGVLSPAAATRYLLDSTNDKRAIAPDDEAQALGLAEDLGRLALALTHAAAYIERHGLSLSAYRAELERTFERVLGFKGKGVRDHADSTLATLEISLGRATAEGRVLLELLAFLADEPVPRFLLEVPVPGAEDADLREAEADLADYSLVTRDMDAGSFSVHRLVREVVRRRLPDAEARTRLEQALGWVNAAFVGDPQDVRSWPRLLPLAEHAEAAADRAVAAGIDEPTGRLMGALGVLFDARAQYARAERLKRAALAIGERSLGPDHPTVATSPVLWRKRHHKIAARLARVRYNMQHVHIPCHPRADHQAGRGIRHHRGLGRTHAPSPCRPDAYRRHASAVRSGFRSGPDRSQEAGAAPAMVRQWRDIAADQRSPT